GREGGAVMRGRGGKTLVPGSEGGGGEEEPSDAGEPAHPSYRSPLVVTRPREGPLEAELLVVPTGRLGVLVEGSDLARRERVLDDARLAEQQRCVTAVERSGAADGDAPPVHLDGRGQPDSASRSMRGIVPTGDRSTS